MLDCATRDVSPPYFNVRPTCRLRLGYYVVLRKVISGSAADKTPLLRRRMCRVGAAHKLTGVSLEASSPANVEVKTTSRKFMWNQSKQYIGITGNNS